MNSEASRSEVLPVVIAPTYNNADTLLDVLRRIEAVGAEILVINDGSTDGTAGLLAKWMDGEHAVRVAVLTHPRNRGKAAALRTGFDAASAAGYTHAVTVDTDGQHDPEQIPELIEAAKRSPRALILGSRTEVGTDCPASHRVGWYMSALGIWLETGRAFNDSQCGLRVYPMSLTNVVRCRAPRYGFEAEIISRAAWAGAPIVEVPVRCHYAKGADYISHFRPWRDGLRGFLMHARLTLRRLNPWPHPKVAGISHAPEPGPWPAIRINPAAMWEALRSDRLGQVVLAGSFGIGTFIANMPLGGFEILLAVYAAWRLHVHMLPVVAGSLLCLGAAGAALSRAAITVGHLLLHASPPDLTALDPGGGRHWRTLAEFPLSWPLGGIVIGFLCNWIIIAVLVALFRLVPVRAEVRRERFGAG